MSFRYFLTTTALCLTAAGPGFALTAEEVWENWQSTATASGQTMTAGSTNKSGDTLTITDLTVSAMMPDGTVETNVSEVTMTESGGAVEILSSPSYVIRMQFTDIDGTEGAVNMSLTHQGLVTTATGSPGAINYDFTADKLTFALGEIEAPDVPEQFDMSFVIDNMAGNYTTGAGTQVDTDFTADELTVNLEFSDPNDGSATVTGGMVDLVSSSSGTLSPFTGGQNLLPMLREGLSSEGEVTFGQGGYTVEGSGPDGDFVIETSSSSGNFTYALTEGGLRYGGGNTDVSVNFIAPGQFIPPVQFQIARSNGEVEMPMIATSDARPFGIDLDIEGLQVSDTLWSMIDPTGGLPRDPADIALDIDGMGNWDVELLDPEAMAAAETSGEMPGKVQSVDLSRLLLRVAGAELTGTGAFTFNNSTVPPVPAGKVNLELMGGNGLLDKLVAIGIVPEEQAMGARMMLGLFARPGNGPDSLVSEIEVKEDGSILANGQRIQ
ncbi:MAG: DUF2125 domain-containing protein [Pseudomonadota bacterium]